MNKINTLTHIKLLFISLSTFILYLPQLFLHHQSYEVFNHLFKHSRFLTNHNLYFWFVFIWLVLLSHLRFIMRGRHLFFKWCQLPICMCGLLWQNLMFKIDYWNFQCGIFHQICYSMKQNNSLTQQTLTPSLWAFIYYKQLQYIQWYKYVVTLMVQTPGAPFTNMEWF